MPNYCQNNLTIRARTPEDLQDFLDKVKGDEEPLSFQPLCPTPDELMQTEAPSALNADLQEKYGYSNWFDWRIANWGTKWDCMDVEELNRSTTGDSIEFFFLTAWAPPVEWLGHIAPLFPNLRFLLSYREEGNGFEGDSYAFRDILEDDCRQIADCYDEEFYSDDWD